MPREALSANQLVESYIKHVIKSKPLTSEAAGKYASHLIAKSPVFSAGSTAPDEKGSLEHYRYLCGITGLSSMHFCWFTYSALGKTLKDHIMRLETKFPTNMNTTRVTTTAPTIEQRNYRSPIIQLELNPQQDLAPGDIKFALNFIYLVEKIHMWYNPVTKQGSGPGLSLDAIEQRFLGQVSSVYFDRALSSTDHNSTSITNSNAPWSFSILPSLSSSSPIYVYNVQRYACYFNALREKSHCGIIIPTVEEIVNVYALVTWKNLSASERFWERILFAPYGLHALYSYIYTENCLLISKACNCYKNSFFLARKIFNTSFSTLFELFAIRNKAQSIIPLMDSQQLYKIHIPYSLFLRSAANISEILSNIAIYRLFRPFFGRAIHNCFGSSWFSVIESRTDTSVNKRGPYPLTTKLLCTFLKFNEYATISKAYSAPFWDSNLPSGQVPYNSYFMYVKRLDKGEQQDAQNARKIPKIYQYNVPYYEKSEKISFQPMDPAIYEVMNSTPTEFATNIQQILNSNKEEGCSDDNHEYTSFLPLERPILIIASTDDRLVNWSNELTNMQLNQYALYCSSDSASIDFIRRYIFTISSGAPNRTTSECDACKFNNCPCQHQPSEESVAMDSAPTRGRPPRMKKEFDLLQSPVLCSHVSESLTSFIRSLREDTELADLLPLQGVSPIEVVSLIHCQDGTQYSSAAKYSAEACSSDVQVLISDGFGANFRSQALKRASRPSDIRTLKPPSFTTTTIVKKSQPKTVKVRVDPSGSPSEPRQYTALEHAILKNITKDNHLCATWPQKSNGNFTRRLQLLSETGYHLRWSTCTPVLAVSKCSCSVIMGAWCSRCNFNLGTTFDKSLEDQATYTLQKPADSSLSTVGVSSQGDIDLTDYLEDCHNYYIKPHVGDDNFKDFTVIKEPLSQAFVEPYLKMSPSDAVFFQRNGKQVLSIKRICRQLPAHIIVASFQAAMRLLDVFSQIPFESIFIEEALEMTPQQYSYLDCCYNLTSKHRFFAGRREFPIFTTEPLAKVANISLSEKVPADLLKEALTSLNSIEAEVFHAGLTILSFLIHIPKDILLSTFQVISEALASIFNMEHSTAIKPTQILFTFALLDFLDASYLPEAIHSQIVAAELAVFTSMREKNKPPDSATDLSRALNNMSIYFAGYPRDQVKISTIDEYKRKCAEFYSDIKQKVTDAVSRHTPYRIFSVLFLHIQAYNLDTEVAKLHIPANLLRQLNVALTPFGPTVLRKSIEAISASSVLNTVRCSNGLVCGCGLIAHNPDYIQQQELSELQALSSRDISTSTTSLSESYGIGRLSTLQLDFLSVSKLGAEVCAELQEFLLSKPSIQPAFVFLMQQTLDQVILQRAFFDIDANVRRVLFDDSRPVLLKKYIELEVPNTLSKISYPLYITVARYTVFQLLIYLWTDACLSLGEEYTKSFKLDSSCFNDINENAFFNSPVTYHLHLSQSRALQISALTSAFIHQDKLLSDHSAKLTKAAGLSSTISQAIFIRTKTALVYLVPDIMVDPTLTFLRYIYANKVTVVDVQATLTSDSTEKTISERLLATAASADDDISSICKLITYVLSRLFLSVVFDSIFTPDLDAIGIESSYPYSNESSDDSAIYPACYQYIKDAANSTCIGAKGDLSGDLVVSVIPETLLIMLLALSEACAQVTHPVVKGKNKLIPAGYDFTTLLVAMPFVSTRPLAHLFTKLCYEYQILSKCPAHSISAPSIIQNVCQQSLEDSLLLTQSVSTHTLCGEIHSLSATLREYITDTCSSIDLKQGIRKGDMSSQLSATELIRVCVQASCTLSQQHQANIGNQMSKLTDTSLNLKPQSLYFMDPLVRRTVSAWLDCDLLLQGAIQHLFMNVKTTLRDMMQACKSKSDESLLRSHSLVSVAQTRAVYRQHYQDSKTLKRKDRGQHASTDEFDALKMVVDPTPFYVYYAGSPTTTTIFPIDSSFSNDIASSVDSSDTAIKVKDVAGPSKSRNRVGAGNAGISMESGSIDNCSEEHINLDLFRGSPAFSVISGNVVGTSSINAPLFSKIGRLFRRPEGPTLTATEFLYTYLDASVEHSQSQANTQVTAVSMQNTLIVSIQPPIPPKLDSGSMNHPTYIVPRLSTPTSSVEISKESNSVQYYINSYSSILTPLYTLDKSFPVCQECYAISIREKGLDLSTEKRKLLKQYGMQPVAADSPAAFSLPKGNLHLKYTNLDHSLLHYCFICQNLFDPGLSATPTLDIADLKTLVHTYQLSNKPSTNPQSIITPTSQTIFRQCKLYQESSLENQSKILSDGVYQSNLTCLSYYGANEHEGLCVQCVEEAGLPPALESSIYLAIDGLLKRHALFYSTPTSLLEEYALAYTAAAYSYVFSGKCIGCASEVQTPNLFFSDITRDDISKTYRHLVYNYQYIIYGRVVCELLNHLLHTTVTSLDGQESIHIQFMSLQQKMNSSCQTKHPFDRIGIRAIIHILTNFFSAHIKKNTLQSTVLEYSRALAKIYMLFKHKTICSAIDFAIPYTLYSTYSSLRALLRRCNLDKKIFSEQWLRMYDITTTVLHTNLRTIDTNLVFVSLGYNSIFFKYYAILRLLLADIPAFLLDPQAPRGHEYSYATSALKEEGAYLVFLLKHIFFYGHSLIPSPELPCYSHILLKFSSMLLAYNGVHPCKMLNSNELCEFKESLINGRLYDSENILADNLFIYYFFTNVPQLISLCLEREDATPSSLHRSQGLDLCQELFRTFTTLEFSVSHVLADLGTIQFAPQLAYVHRLIRAKVRTISMGSPLALVDTALLSQYIHACARNGFLTVDSFATLFSCDYSWIYRLAFGVYHYEIPTNQDYLALIQSASEENVPKVLCSSVSEAFMQRLCSLSDGVASNTSQPFEKHRYGVANIRQYPHSITKIQANVVDESPSADYGLHQVSSLNITSTGLEQEPFKQLSMTDNLYSERFPALNPHIYDSPLMNSLDVSSISSSLPGNTERTTYQDKTSSLLQPSTVDNGASPSSMLNSVLSTQLITEPHSRVAIAPVTNRIQLDLFKDNAIYSKNTNVPALLPQATLQGLAPIPTKVLLHVVLRTIRMLLMRAYPMDNQSSMFYPQIAFAKVHNTLSVALGDFAPLPQGASSDLVSTATCTQATTIDGAYISLSEQSDCGPKRRARLHVSERFLVIGGTYMHGGLFDYNYEPYRFPDDHTDLDLFFLRYLINYMYIPQRETGKQDLLAVFLQDPVSGISMKEHTILSTLMSTNFVVSGLVADSIEQQKLESLVSDFEALVPEGNRQLLVEVIMSIGVGLGTTPLEMYESIIRTYCLIATKDRYLPISTILQASVTFLQILWLMVKKCRKLPDELKPYVQTTDISRATHDLYLLRILQGKLKELSVRYNYLLFSFDWCSCNTRSKYGTVFSRGLQQVPVVENYWLQCCNQYTEDFSLQSLVTHKPASNSETGANKPPTEGVQEPVSPETAAINDIACSPAALSYRFLWNISYYLPPFYYSSSPNARIGSSTNARIPLSRSSQYYRQQGTLQQGFNTIKQYILTVHPTACAIDLTIDYIDYMYSCMMDPTYVSRYSSTPLTMCSLFTVQEYGLTDLKNCWLYLTYCKIEFLEKFGLNLQDIVALKNNPTARITDNDIKIITTIAELIHSAWSKLSDLKLLHAYVQYRGRYQQVLMDKKEYNCAHTTNTIQLTKILLPIFQQLTTVLEKAYNKPPNCADNDAGNLLFPTHTLIQQRDIKIHPGLEERWNAYYVHAIPWQAVVPSFSDEFLFNFDLLQRLRRVPNPEQIVFAIKQFLVIIKDKWPSILPIISMPVSAEFVKERHRLLLYGLATERILLSNLNEQYYNHDLNSVLDISRNIMQDSKSHVRFIALKAHPENRLSEIFSTDISSYSSSIQATYTQSQASGNRSASVGYAPGAPGAILPHHMTPKLGQYGSGNTPQHYKHSGEYHDTMFCPQERLQYQQGMPGSSGMPYGASGNNRGYGRIKQGAMEYYQRGDVTSTPRYPGMQPQYHPPTRYDPLAARPSAYLKPNVYGPPSMPYQAEQGSLMHQQPPNQHYPLAAPRAASAPGSHMRFGQYPAFNQEHLGYQNSSPYLSMPYYQTQTPSHFSFVSHKSYSRPYADATSFGPAWEGHTDITTTGSNRPSGDELSISSYRETLSAVLKLLNRLFPSVVNRKNNLEGSERALFEHMAALYFQDNLFFEKPLNEDAWRYALGYMSLVREQPLREDELIIQANVLINRINHVTNKCPGIIDTPEEHNVSVLQAFCKKFDQFVQVKKNEIDHHIIIKVGKDCAAFFLSQAYCCAFELRKSYIETRGMSSSLIKKMNEMLELCTQILPISEVLSSTDVHLRKQLLLVLLIKNLFEQQQSKA